MRSNRRKLADLERRAAAVGRGGWLSVSNMDRTLPAGCYSDRHGNVYTRDQLRELEPLFECIVILSWIDGDEPGSPETPENAGDRVISLSWGEDAEDD